MTILIDTHAFLWFTLGDSRLSETAKTTIEASSNAVLISPASYWEIAVKISVGKYRLHCSYEEFWQKAMQDNRISVLPIEPRHTAGLISLPFHHKDPFDRLLVAQALVEQIPLVSSDSALDAYGIQRIW